MKKTTTKLSSRAFLLIAAAYITFILIGGMFRLAIGLQHLRYIEHYKTPLQEEV